MRLRGCLKENPALCNINLIVIQTFLKHPGSVCPVMHLLYDIVVRIKDKRAISWGQNKDGRSRKTKLAIYRILLPFIFWISGNFVASERFYMERSASCGESRRLRGVARCWSHHYYPLPAVGPPSPHPPPLPLLAFRTFSWKMLAATQGQGL